MHHGPSQWVLTSSISIRIEQTKEKVTKPFTLTPVLSSIQVHQNIHVPDELVSYSFVRWCFEASQARRITLGLKKGQANTHIRLRHLDTPSNDAEGNCEETAKRHHSLDGTRNLEN